MRGDSNRALRPGRPKARRIQHDRPIDVDTRIPISVSGVIGDPDNDMQDASFVLTGEPVEGHRQKQLPRDRGLVTAEPGAPNEGRCVSAPKVYHRAIGEPQRPFCGSLGHEPSPQSSAPIRHCRELLNRVLGGRFGRVVHLDRATMVLADCHLRRRKGDDSGRQTRQREQNHQDHH